MATLMKNGNKYYSQIRIRVGERYSYINGERKENHKRKSIYINLNTSKYGSAEKRNEIVTHEEEKIRHQISLGNKTKSDLLKMNDTKEWSWFKSNGSKTSSKLLVVDDYINKFIEICETKHMKESTIDAYRYALNRFSKVVGTTHLIADTCEDDIDDFMRSMEKQKKPLTESSMDSNLKSLSAFLKWCKKRNYIANIPEIVLFNPILPNKWFTEEEYNAILNHKYSDRRFPMMFKLYAETGMRLTEGFNGVLTEDENGIWLSIPNEKSKSGKGRTIQLNEEQRDTIQLIQSLWYEGGCKKDHVKYYSRKLKDAMNELNLPKHKHFHSLRHYYGKTMIIITGNIYVVSGLMGHSSVKVTESSYVKNFDRKESMKDFPSLKKYLLNKPKNE